MNQTAWEVIQTILLVAILVVLIFFPRVRA